MSNAVILEGNVNLNEENPLWSGLWRFAKDKKGILQFNYKKIGLEIPSDLLEYVSFMDPASVAQSNANKQSLTNPAKVRKRGRGRPPLSASLSSSSVIFATNPIVESNELDGVKNDEDKGVERYTENFEKKDVTSTNQHLDLDGDNGGDNKCNELEVDMADIDQLDNDTTVAKSDNRPVFIDPFHALMGVWEGNFSVMTQKGEEFINEKLFFHTTLGVDPRNELKDLPPEPQFPYTLLKRNDSNSVKVPTNPQIIEPTSLVIDGESDNVNGIQNSLSTCGDIALDQLPSLNETDNDVIQDALSATAYGYSTATLESLYKKVLIGFGRNSIGRFSVAALFDESTGEFKCEKKYMSVKYAVKRGRRSHAEYALNYAAQPNTAVDRSNIVRRNTITELIPPQTRNRPPKLTIYDEDSGEANTKRKRSNTTTSRGKSGEEFVFPRSSSSKPKDNLLSDSMHHLGLKNPDHDDPNCTYRDAFQDCDTGEIYEGSWAYGFRHGRGICLYCDGLMYEGNWVRGKEHGKGVLMTADRRVIYTGDWLDGQMHGFGVYNFGNGDIYRGDWKEGSRHGKGEYVFLSGCVYIGDWRDNKRHGKGKFVWADGSFYEGDWENDLRHGRGNLELVNGFKYDGYWSRNVMEGKGTCVFPSGQMYQGTYKSGLRDGRGSVQFAESAVYEGRFKEDRLDGQGTLKINGVVPGVDEDELLIPVQIQSDLWRIHWKAGFGANAH